MTSLVESGKVGAVEASREHAEGSTLQWLVLDEDPCWEATVRGEEQGKLKTLLTLEFCPNAAFCDDCEPW